ncbi:histone-lysine N-methyltransferase SETMAR [Nephila pilipes]|uniref:Histone-lysine N-methyltransferase SETMAR n=1 Tax=Nephila pilipes TaxID=299642 RepID=A0A8X6U6P6_NEPPI|nr:histone-lysine N-methyltransferase SETMAR [Nephila pilipes]
MFCHAGIYVLFFWLELIYVNFQIIRIEYQVKKDELLRHLLLFAFNQVFTAVKSAHGFCALCGEGVMAESTARDWYAKFEKGNLDPKNTPCFGCGVKLYEERLNQLLLENSSQTTRELAEKMECSRTAIEKRLHSMEKDQKSEA